VDDFYVYYETNTEAKVGVIKAIAPRELAGFGDGHIRIPGEFGRKFNTGEETPTKWEVRWNGTEMAMCEKQEVPPSLSCGLVEVKPHDEQSEIEVVLTYYGISVTGETVADPDNESIMWFFVTKKDDPNVLIAQFPVKVKDLHRRCDAGKKAKGTFFLFNDLKVDYTRCTRGSENDVPCFMNFYSIYTKPTFDSYRLRYGHENR